MSRSVRVVRQGTGEGRHAWCPRWFSTYDSKTESSFQNLRVVFKLKKRLTVKLPGPAGACPQ